MGKLINIDAEDGANIIDDGADPTLVITNTSGAALETNKLVVTSAATIAMGKLTLNTPILAANATVTGMHVRGASVASGAVMTFTAGALVSLTSILATTGGVAGTYGLRVVKPDGTFGWIPVYPDAAVTAALI